MATDEEVIESTKDLKKPQLPERFDRKNSVLTEDVIVNSAIFKIRIVPDFVNLTPQKSLNIKISDFSKMNDREYISIVRDFLFKMIRQ